MAKNKKNSVDRENKSGNKLLTALIATLFIVIWLAIFALLIKLDVNGFGSGVLRPILKDVPIINRILPDVSDAQLSYENDYPYTSLIDAVARIKELEATIADMEAEKEAEVEDADLVAQLEAEIERLKHFEEKQLEFEQRVLAFDKEVVYAEAAPSTEEYRKYYEEINPSNAEIIYRQVIEQLKYSEAIKEKADIYKNMDPEEAALILETMTADVESVAKILLSMKPKESAAIMQEMDNVFAAKVTKRMLDMDAERLAE